jgi:hypothetical protein
MRKLPALLAVLVIATGFAADTVTAQPPAPAAPASAASGPTLSRDEMEAFLLRARVVKRRDAPKGVTGTLRATLTDGTLTHDASIQTIDEYRPQYPTPRGFEFNFRDTWRFNVAAYKLDKLLGLRMVPATVARSYRGADASFTWWVDDVLMDEGHRLKTRTSPPDSLLWNQQMWIVRVFDQLIYNTDRNVGNLLIDKNWRLWMIDHSRAFRWHDTLLDGSNLTRCDRGLLERLRALDAKTLEKEMRRYLGGAEIKALLARRDLIVAHFERAGPAALFDATR